MTEREQALEQARELLSKVYSEAECPWEYDAVVDVILEARAQEREKAEAALKLATERNAALLEAAVAKLENCEDCMDAALLPGELCSDECAALAAAVGDLRKLAAAAKEGA